MFKTSLKSKLVIAVMVMFGITAFMSCEKAGVSSLETTNLEQKKLDEMIPLQKNNKLLVDFLRSQEFKNYNEKIFGNLNLNEAFVFYPSIDSNYYYIVIESDDTYENSSKKVLTRLLSVVNKQNNKVTSIVLRAEAMKDNGKFIAAQETYYSYNGGYIGFKLYNTDKLIYKPLSNILVKAEYGDFNDCYQSKKKECEDDWLCDFACSFNPCAVSYAGACVIEGLNGNIDSWN